MLLLVKELRPMDGKRLRKLRNEKKLTQSELGRIINVSKVSVSGYESGDRTPDTDNLGRLADFFEVSSDYLLGRTDNPNYIKTNMIKEAYKSMDGYNMNFKPKVEMIRVPVLGHIAAGKPILATEHIEDYQEIANTFGYDPREVFLLTVKGDSMIGSRIQEGDRVLVKMQQEVENGQIAVVNVNGDEATLKRVKKLESGQTLLMPSNDKYEPILIDHEDARIIGKVIQVIFEP